MDPVHSQLPEFQVENWSTAWLLEFILSTWTHFRLQTQVIVVRLTSTWIPDVKTENIVDFMIYFIIPLIWMSIFMPRVGPLRALFLKAYTFAFPIHQTQKSFRKKNFDELSKKFSSLSSSNALLVTGPPGVGKSCLIDTVLEGKSAVLDLELESYWSFALKDTLIGCLVGPFNIFSSIFCASWVSYWFRIIFREPLTIVIRQTRKSDQDLPEMLSELQSFAKKTHVRIVLDWGPLRVRDSQYLKPNYQLEEYHVSYLSQEDIDSLFPDLKTVLEKVELSKLVWSVLGGSLVDYEQLNRFVRSISKESDDLIKTNIHDFCQFHLRLALSNVFISNVDIQSLRPKMNVVSDQKHSDLIFLLSSSSSSSQLYTIEKDNSMTPTFSPKFQPLILVAVPALKYILENNITSEDKLKNHFDPTFKSDSKKEKQPLSPSPSGKEADQEELEKYPFCCWVNQVRKSGFLCLVDCWKGRMNNNSDLTGTLSKTESVSTNKLENIELKQMSTN